MVDGGSGCWLLTRVQIGGQGRWEGLGVGY